MADNDKIVDFNEGKAKVGNRAARRRASKNGGAAAGGTSGQASGVKFVKKDMTNADPQTTINVNNDELNAAIEAFKENNIPENFIKVINLLNDARILIPATFDANHHANPIILKNPDGNLIQPIFTDKSKLPDREKVKHDGVLNMPFAAVAVSISKQENVKGVVINMHDKDILLKREILLQIANFAEGKRKGEIPADAKMTLGGEQNGKLRVFKDGKVSEVDPAEVNPQETIDVKNPELEELLDVFRKEQTNENLTKLVNRLINCRVLVPAALSENKIPMPLTINTKDGKKIQPVFSQKEQIPEKPKAEVVMNIPFMDILKAVMAGKPTVDGIGVNAFTNAVILNKELLENIDKNVSTNKTKNTVIEAASTGKMPVTGADTEITPEELEEKKTALRERVRFEQTNLPKAFFGDGQSVIDGLCNEKEVYLDKLYEESYENPRMYPYLLEDFRVMPMSISDNLEVVIVNMPSADSAVGTAEAVYLTWNGEEKSGRYFAILKARGKDAKQVIELKADGTKIVYPDFPEEGLELSYILGKLEN